MSRQNESGIDFLRKASAPSSATSAWAALAAATQGPIPMPSAGSAYPGAMAGGGFWNKPKPASISNGQSAFPGAMSGSGFWNKPGQSSGGPTPAGYGPYTGPPPAGPNRPSGPPPLDFSGGAGSNPSYGPTPPPTMPEYSGPSGEEMAKAEFGPQYEALRRISEQLKSRYDTGFKDTGAMYNALSADTRGHTDQIRQQYDQTGQKIGGLYNEATAKVSDTVAKNQQATAEILARLGVAGQAAPTALASQTEALTRAVGNIQDHGSSRQGFAAQQGQNETDYNNRTADSQAMAGLNQQGLLTRQYSDQAAQNDNKGLDLRAGETAAANKYGMSINQMRQSAQQAQMDGFYKQQGIDLQRSGQDIQRSGQLQQGQIAAADQETKRAGQLFDAKKWEAQIASDNNKASLDASRLQLDSEKALNNSGDPYAILASRANGLYGNSPDAPAAVSTIVNSYSALTRNTGGKVPTLGEFTDKLWEYAKSPDEHRKLAALATVWWKQLDNKGAFGGPT